MPMAQLSQQRLAAMLPQRDDLVRPKPGPQPGPPQDPRLVRLQVQKGHHDKAERARDREEGEVSDDAEDELIILPNDAVSRRGGGGGGDSWRSKMPGIRGGDGVEGGGRGEEASKKMETSACTSKSAARTSVVTLLSSSDEEDSRQPAGPPPASVFPPGSSDKKDPRKRQRTDAITICSGSLEACRGPSGVGARSGPAGGDVGLSLVCASCANHFTFSEEERGRLLEKGVRSIPSTCRPCRMGQKRPGSGAAGSGAHCGERTGGEKAAAVRVREAAGAVSAPVAPASAPHRFFGSADEPVRKGEKLEARQDRIVILD